MRRVAKGVFVLSLIALAVVLGILGWNKFHGSDSTAASKKPAASAPAVSVAALEDVGPGGCVPGKSILDQLRKTPPVPHEDFKAPYDQVELAILTENWITWVQAHESTNCVKAMAASVNVKVADLPTYLRDKVTLTELKAPITVQNTYYQKDTGKIVNWKVQTFPKGELIWMSEDGKTPVFKYVCGNRLYPVGQHAPPAKTTTASCTSNCGSTHPVCTSNCGTTTPKCTKTPSPGSGYTWSQSKCKWIPPTSSCVKPPSPGSGYTWDQGKCKWIPPTSKCVQPPKPGSGYTWDQAHCKWVPPTSKCTKTPSPGSGWTWDQNKCKWLPPKTCTQCVTPIQVQQPVQDNTVAENNGANIGPTVGAPKTEPVNVVAPVNNRGDGTTKPTKAPPPTVTGSNSGHSDGSTTPSGSTTDGSGTTTSGTVTNAPVDTGQGNTSASGTTTTVNTGMPTTPG